jgi:hypothetical protein
MIRLVDTCQVCGGKGKFLESKCLRCAGNGGKIIPFDARFRFYLEPHLSRLSEQEKKILDLYLENLTLEEISRSADIAKSSVIFLLRQIERKVNKGHG